MEFSYELWMESKLYKWEIGHLISLNQGGLNNPENLSFQSSRCNQHIQTSMNYYETTEYNCKNEVKQRIDKLFILHKSKEWNNVIEQINALKYSLANKHF